MTCLNKLIDAREILPEIKTIIFHVGWQEENFVPLKQKLLSDRHKISILERKRVLHKE